MQYKKLTIYKIPNFWDLGGSLKEGFQWGASSVPMALAEYIFTNGSTITRPNTLREQIG